MTANTNTQDTTATEDVKATPCACGGYEIEIWTGQVPEGADPAGYVKYVGTGCISDTTRTFAPGHDAKLKSLLIQAGASGDGVRYNIGGTATTSDAQKVANSYGFGDQVASGIRRAKAKAEAKNDRKTAAASAKNERDAAKAARQAEQKAAKAERDAAKETARAERTATQAKIVDMRIKVGRWEYDAKVNTADNTATFTSGSGETKTVADDKWTMVAV